VKGPNAVTKTFPLMAAQSRNRFVFAELFESVCIGALKKAAVKAADDFAESSAVRCDTNPIAVTFLATECDVTGEVAASSVASPD